MTFPNPFATKTARVSKILASEVNAAGVSISRAVDGTGGGTYTPSGIVQINGSGIGTNTVLSCGAASTATLAGTNALSGTNTFSGTTTQSGALTVTGATVRSGTGATYRDRVTNASDADGTYTTDYDAYRVPDVTNNRTYTLSNPAADGLTILFSRVVAANAFGVAIRRVDTTLIGTLPSSAQSWIMFKSLGGVWTSFMWGGGAGSIS